MRLEHKRGSLHASHVRSAFVRALQTYLPSEAFAQLDTLPMERDVVEHWADAHGINAPCVVEAFAHYCQGGWSKQGHCESDSWRGPHIPGDWLQAVGEFNKKPIDPPLWRGMYADELVLTEAWLGRAVAGIEPDQVTAMLDRYLGPIGADPARESWEDFQFRARSHWTARAVAAKKFGFRPAGNESEWRNLERDIKWLLQHQVSKQTLVEIAALEDQENDAFDPDRVKKAIDRLSNMIGLKRKRGRRAGSSRKRSK